MTPSNFHIVDLTTNPTALQKIRRLEDELSDLLQNQVSLIAYVDLSRKKDEKDRQ